MVYLVISFILRNRTGIFQNIRKLNRAFYKSFPCSVLLHVWAAPLIRQQVYEVRTYVMSCTQETAADLDSVGRVPLKLRRQSGENI